MPSLLGSKFADDLLKALPTDGGVSRVQCKGRYKRVSLSARRCYQYRNMGAACGTKKVMTGGAIITLSFDKRPVVVAPEDQRVARLKPGWTDRAFNRAVQRLMDAALHDTPIWERRTAIYNLMEPLNEVKGYLAAIDVEEAKGRETIYDSMSEEDCDFWEAWAAAFKKEHGIA
jgi:hypothetical protein